MDRDEVQKIPEGNASIEDDSLDAQCMKYAGDPIGFWEKGNISNCTTAAIMIVGLALRIVYNDDWKDSSVAGAVAGRYILAAGLFGFAGGVTNWIAVKMLFDPLPTESSPMPGTGIIPRQFKSIRDTIKKMIMDTFFDETFLEKQLAGKLLPNMSPDKVQDQLQKMISTDEFETLLESKLEKILSDGGMVARMITMMGMDHKKMMPFIKMLVNSISPNLSKLLNDTVQEGNIVGKMRESVDRLVTDRLSELTPNRVKMLLQAVMERNLGWLVVW
eukprot:CAMPEP_0197851682 /NCGR_PEP_ID=MMETSP1438-20131217/18609_1 /TAXON_ID=1461541 /ORGANISM="Pterosperma sp., Strain CCMP1384" /LENGTH=273 /DNA_ID=CAMNT_0043465379 /DNA_START=316 /DNA_END=1134 /DNA_ORIENTATION=+